MANKPTPAGLLDDEDTEPGVPTMVARLQKMDRQMKRVSEEAAASCCYLRRARTQLGLWPAQPKAGGASSAMIREHSHDPLFIKPLSWTSQDLEILGCEFVKLDRPPGEAVDGRSNAAQNDANKKDNKILEAIQGIFHYSGRDPKSWVVNRLLQHFSIFELPVQFSQQKPVHTLFTEGILTAGNVCDAAPVIAYLGLESDSIAERRNRVRATQRASPPCKPMAVSALLESSFREKLMRPVQPESELEDPFLAAVMIALAQQLHMRRRPARAFKVHILTLADSPQEEPTLFFYQSVISKELLERLDRPSLYIPARPITISHFQMPLYPYEEAIDVVNRFLANTDDGMTNCIAALTRKEILNVTEDPVTNYIIYHLD
ncbi:hypothetical protein B0H63DRAFT_453461 [Podospora didyma]|uniref:Uncharacterized protein n=1 Tax=Podospora didyma TaxID=330526 RepID=A0AAE0N7A1_9PEZI|nr:hypothetical protein B0H63DRAFT_453461 [Podospora didyma]